MHTCPNLEAFHPPAHPPKALGHMQDPSKDVSFRPKKCIPVQIQKPLTLQPTLPRLWAICKTPQRTSVFAPKNAYLVSYRPKQCIPVQIQRPLTLQPTPPRLWAKGRQFSPQKMHTCQIQRPFTLQPTLPRLWAICKTPQRTSVFAPKNAYLVSYRPKKCIPVQIQRPLTLQPTPPRLWAKGRQFSPRKMHTCQIQRPFTLQPTPPRLWAICKTPQRTSVFAPKDAYLSKSRDL